MSITRISGHTFFDGFINSNSSIVDLGANTGNFSKGMIDRFGCHCYAVEAAPSVFDLIPSSDYLQKFNFAVAKQSGTVNFHVAQNTEMSSLYVSEGATTDKQIAVTAKRLDEFLMELHITSLDLLKIDVEGAEVDVLDSCSDDLLKTISQITVEFHDFNDMVSRSEVSRIMQRLKNLGFFCVVMTRPSYGHEDVCFINRQRCSVSWAEILWVSHITRNLKGLMRLSTRKMNGLANGR